MTIINRFCEYNPPPLNDRAFQKDVVQDPIIASSLFAMASIFIIVFNVAWRNGWFYSPCRVALTRWEHHLRPGSLSFLRKNKFPLASMALRSTWIRGQNRQKFFLLSNTRGCHCETIIDFKGSWELLNLSRRIVLNKKLAKLSLHPFINDSFMWFNHLWLMTYLCGLTIYDSFM